ncbi:MAG: hypothetical protein ACRD3Y_04340, partial [Bryobacteraceae bacterium]
MKAFLVFLTLTTCVFAAPTTARFQSPSTSIGPFPSNVLTRPDPAQATGLRVNLPADACNPASSPAVCGYQTMLNQLDGFSVNPRLMACFSGPVNAASLANGMFVVPLTNGTPGNRIPVQQIIFDPTSRCAFAEPTQVLHQRSQYLLIVTSAVQDAGGAPVAASPQFSACLGASGTYCQNLAGAVAELPPTPSDAASVVSASLFTTMSTTSWLERARNYVNATEFPIVLPAGLPFSFRVSNIQSMQWIPSDTDIGPQDIPVSALSGVGKVAFGFFLSPNFLSSGGAPAGTIPVTPTGEPIPLPSRFAVPISFHVFLPATPP